MTYTPHRTKTIYTKCCRLGERVPRQARRLAPNSAALGCFMGVLKPRIERFLLLFPSFHFHTDMYIVLVTATGLIARRARTGAQAETDKIVGQLEKIVLGNEGGIWWGKDGKKRESGK